MKILLPYGRGKTELEIPDKNMLGIIKPEDTVPVPDAAEEVRRALKSPAGPRLKDIVSSGKKILIAVSDISRPASSRILIPPILEELHAGGAAAEDISLVFALGIHRRQSEAEKVHLIGEEIYRNYRCLEHNIDDCVYAGTTVSGTRAELYREAVETDYLIATGNIEFHYFAGFSGGAKAVAPGLCGRETTAVNHSRFTRSGCRPGNLEGNPLRMELEEIADMAGVDFMLNAVLDGKQNLLLAAAGNVRDAHRKGADFLRQNAFHFIEERADIVVVSPGGYPKDLDLYQTHKAMEHALPALKRDGIMIIAGSCEEGLGVPAFADVFEENPRPEDLAAELETRFVQGRHIACRIAAIHLRNTVYLVSSLPEDIREKIFVPQFHSVQDALERALEQKGPDASVWVMPYGISVVPKPCHSGE